MIVGLKFKVLELERIHFISNQNKNDLHILQIQTNVCLRMRYVFEISA